MNENLRPVDGLNTYGLTPKTDVAWKTFTVDGWQLLAQPDSNDDGDGWGIRYTTVLEDSGIGSVSVWIGNVNDNERTEALFDKIFAELDEQKAHKAMQVLLDQVGPHFGQTRA